MNGAANLRHRAFALHNRGHLGRQVRGPGADDVEAQDLIRGLVVDKLGEALVLALVRALPLPERLNVPTPTSRPVARACSSVRPTMAVSGLQ